MKRGAIGLGLLVFLLAAGLLVTWGMDHCHDRIAEDLEDAAEHALMGDWEQAEKLSQGAEKDWERCWNFSASFADHEPMEEIDGLFAQLEIYEKAREKTSFAAACAELSRRVEAMGEAHGLTWWNLL